MTKDETIDKTVVLLDRLIKEKRKEIRSMRFDLKWGVTKKWWELCSE